MSDRIFAAVWLGVCALIIYQMWRLTVPFAYEPVGPKAFPLILAALMILCCGVLLLNPESGIRWPKGRVLLRGALLIGVLVAYGWFFEILGFPLTTVAMVVAVSRLFGGRWHTGLIVALAFGILGYLLFDRLLEVSLPLGRIWS